MYNGDLRAALWGPTPIGVRRLAVLVRGLPTRSAFAREVESDGQEWGATEELLATLVELVDMNNRLLYATAPLKHKRMWDPLRIPRPYAAMMARNKKKQSTQSEVISFLKGASGSVSVKSNDNEGDSS